MNVRRWVGGIDTSWGWRVALPILLAAIYWFGLGSLDLVGDGPWRITFLPKVMFDQTFYLQWVARDLFHETHLVPTLLRPLLGLFRLLEPHISLMEVYVGGVILSAMASLWCSASLIEEVTGASRLSSRWYALGSFALIQSLLVLRPGAPSWYIPFFLLALRGVWQGYKHWEERRHGKALVWWIAALVPASIYPWYVALCIGVVGVSILPRLVTRRRVILGSLGGVSIAWVLLFFQERIVSFVTSSATIQFGVIQGINFGHVTTLSNTVVVLLAWLAFFVTARRFVSGANESDRATLTFFVYLWLAQNVLWWQSVVTGFSMIPDHFIYTAWILSVLSGGFVLLRRELFVKIPPWVVGVLVTGSVLYLVRVFGKVAEGVYALEVFSSLVIHTGIWALLAIASVSLLNRWGAWAFGAFMLLAHLLPGVFSVRAMAALNGGNAKELLGVATWMREQQTAARRYAWCSDYRAGDILSANIGAVFHPSLSDRLIQESLEDKRDRLVEVASLFYARGAGDEYRWDDDILIDLDFQCRAFVPFRNIYARLPISLAGQVFLTGCDEAWASATQREVLERMAQAWSSPIGEPPPACDRLVVRRDLKPFWRIPDGFTSVYQDEEVEVWAKKNRKETL